MAKHETEAGIPSQALPSLWGVLVFRSSAYHESYLLHSQVALVLKNTSANARDTSPIPGSRRSPAEGNGNPLQYSCLENAMDREAWWAIVDEVTKGWIQLKWLSTQRIHI